MRKFDQIAALKNTINHVYTGEFLFYASFSAEMDKKIRQEFSLEDHIDLRDYFGMYNPVNVTLKIPQENQNEKYDKYYTDIDYPKGAFISDLGVLHKPGSSYHFTQFISPLRNAEDYIAIKDYPYPDYLKYSEAGMKEQVERAHANNKPTVCWITQMYEDAWQIRGYEQFLEDMMLNPEWCEYILDKLKERNLFIACAAARAGVDTIITGDDVANQRSLMFLPDMWRRMIKSRWFEIYKAAKAIKPDINIWYHSDGNIEEIIPELLEIGVNILNPIQPECLDPLTVKKRFGDRVVMDGTIGTQTVMPFGTPKEIKEITRRNIEQLGYDGAIIISPTHVLEP